MNHKPLSPKASLIEENLASGGSNSLGAFALQEMSATLTSQGLEPSTYRFFAVRDSKQSGSEVIGPITVPGGTYTEAELYGALKSKLPQFRSQVKSLAETSAKIIALGEDSTEYSYQVTLFWPSIVRLKIFLGLTPYVSDIVSMLLSARYQFINRDTPLASLAAVSSALFEICRLLRIDQSTVDRVSDHLEGGGIDPIAADALRRHA